MRIRQGDIGVVICYITVADEARGFWSRRGGRIGMIGIRPMRGMGRVAGRGTMTLRVACNPTDQLADRIEIEGYDISHIAHRPRYVVWLSYRTRRQDHGLLLGFRAKIRCLRRGISSCRLLSGCRSRNVRCAIYRHRIHLCKRGLGTFQPYYGRGACDERWGKTSLSVSQ